MKFSSLLFQITTIVVFLQLLIGGLLTFDFIDVGVHILTGLLVFFLAIATMIVSLVSKPSSKSLRIISIIMVALIIVQIILGFDTVRTGSQVIAWVHFVNAMAIYGVAISGTFVAVRLDRSNNVVLASQEMKRT